jgi:hypothetical protein
MSQVAAFNLCLDSQGQNPTSPTAKNTLSNPDEPSDADDDVHTRKALQDAINHSNGMDTENGERIMSLHSKDWRERLFENLPYKVDDTLLVNLPTKIDEKF